MPANILCGVSQGVSVISQTEGGVDNGGNGLRHKFVEPALLQYQQNVSNLALVRTDRGRPRMDEPNEQNRKGSQTKTPDDIPPYTILNILWFWCEKKSCQSYQTMKQHQSNQKILGSNSGEGQSNIGSLPCPALTEQNMCIKPKVYALLKH